MGREKKRKRSASNTPPVEWETLLVPNTATVEEPPAAAPAPSADSSRPPKSAEKGKSASNGADEGPSERAAWRALVLRLAALRNDPKFEELLRENHPELKRVAEECGGNGSPICSIEQARESARGWFQKQLKGSNRQGPAERAACCTRLSEVLKARSASILSEMKDVYGNAGEAAASVLARGKTEVEGPLICALLGRELEGSRYENIWISRSGPSRYIIGDEDAASCLPDKDMDGASIDRVIRVAVKVSDGKLVVDGFFHKGEQEMNPVKCQVGPFLTVYFEGLSLKEALTKWKERQERRTKITQLSQPGGITVKSMPVGNNEQDAAKESLRKLAASLPPGWELRESRSKKGVYYYANEAKGLSQNERPRA